MNEDDKTKGERRDEKEQKQRRMRVSGRSVFLTRRIINDRAARAKKGDDEE